MQSSAVNYKDLVLLGGGHSHALVIKMWAMKPLPGVRLTLVSPQVMTPYSGMLPGLVAGHYNLQQTHIDLSRLCQYAGVRFVQAAATGIDIADKQVLFDNRPPIGFDCLSINTGITPELSSPGASEHAIAVKPIARLFPRWQALQQSLRTDSGDRPFSLAVVGGGAAGVEMLLAMEFALRLDPAIERSINWHLVQRGAGLPEGYPAGLQRQLAKRLASLNIQVHENTEVTEVRADALQCQKLSGEPSSYELPVDRVFWCTQAKASNWPAASGLATDERGFIAVNEYLQVEGQTHIFAAGDTAMQTHNPRPRAGVYAVRQGPVLFNNLRNVLLNRSLKPFHPQKTFLSLLACGDKWALGTRPGSLMPTLSGTWVWRWKDRIDRRFMAMFSNLQPQVMAPAGAADPVLQDNPGLTADASAPAMRCGGCGAKVGSDVLSRVLSQLQPCTHEGVVMGMDSPDDAAALRVPADRLLLQSVDVFRALLDDPYLLGQIAAEHALSDLFAMNAAPHSALAIATLPYAAESLVERDLLQLMSGALKVLNRNQCALVGGHTSEGAEMSMGFAVNGCATEQQLLKKDALQAGQKLILTQALGTGTLFAAHGQLRARGEWIEGAIEAMLLSNRQAGEIFAQHGATGCTDVTGFGLLGHLVEMLKPGNHGACLQLAALPTLAGALEMLQEGISSSLQPQNQRQQQAIIEGESWADHKRFAILFDPQTSGGLLASVPEDQVEDCLQALRNGGYVDASVIGEVLDLTVCSEGRVSLCP